MNRHIVAILLVAGLALAAHNAGAAEEFSLTLSAGATHTDNVSRQNTNEESEVTAEAGLVIQQSDDEGRLQSQIGADLLYRHFTDDTFGDELAGGLDGFVNYWFVPELFGWVVQDSFGQALIDPQAVDTAGNRQNFNYFSTGPDIRLRLTESTMLQIQGRWADASYEESNVDNQRLTGSLGLSRQLSALRSISINGSASQIEYDDSAPNSDYDMHSVFVGFDAEGARTALSLQGGYTTLDFLDGSSDGPLVSLTISRALSERSTLTLNAGTNLVDTAEALRRDFNVGGVDSGTGDAIVSNDPFQSDYLSLGWRAEGARTGLSLAIDWRREDHESEAALDRERVGADLGITRRLNPRLSARLSGGWSQQDFDTSGIDFDEWSAGLGLDWAISPGFSLSLGANHFRGSGDTSLGADTRDYDENRVTIRINYRPTR